MKIDIPTLDLFMKYRKVLPTKPKTIDYMYKQIIFTDKPEDFYSQKYN